MDVYTAFFALIGFLAFANWMYCCFASLVSTTYYNVLELLQPDKYSLEKRFGQWAGEKSSPERCSPTPEGQATNQLQWLV